VFSADDKNRQVNSQTPTYRSYKSVESRLSSCRSRS